MLLKDNPITLLFFLFLLLGGGAVSGQGFTDFRDIRPKQNSPLSRFGLGDPLDRWHAAQAGFGGLSATYQNGYHLNLVNPASLASLASTSFEVGLYARNSTLEDNTGSANSWQGNLSYLALGFPLRNPINLSLEELENSWNGGMAFQIAPTTLVGYDLRLVDVDPVTGTTSNNLRGTGGTYKFSWATAGRYRGISGGLSLNYNFGKLTNTRVVLFDSIPDALASEFLEEFSVGGFNLGYGAQYGLDLMETNEEGERVPSGKRIVFGVNGQLGRTLETNANTFFRRFSPTRSLVVSDTLRFEEEQIGELDLPGEVTFGVAFHDLNRLYVGAEYSRSAYSNYRNEAKPEQLVDASRFAVGVEYIPNATSYNRFWQRVRYRAGFRMEDDPRSVNGVQARRNGVSLGLGIPIRLPRQQISFLDFAVEYGKFGAPDVLDESYVQLTLGFSLNDNTWFFKRKLN